MSDSREKILAIYEELVASQPDIQRKGAANPYTSMNGNMFSFITKEDEIALRLPDELREKMKAEPVLQHNAVMRGYALVPKAMLSKPAQLAKLFAQSVAYAATLPAKPTTKKKVAKKKVAKKAAKKAPARRRR
jgi:TfoX-like protein